MGWIGVLACVAAGFAGLVLGLLVGGLLVYRAGEVGSRKNLEAAIVRGDLYREFAMGCIEEEGGAR